MRRAAGLGLLLIAAPLGSALELEEARHLLTRTGFGASPAEIAALRPLSRAAAVRKLLDGVRTSPLTPPPEFVHEAPPNRQAMQMLPRLLKRSMNMENRQRGEQLKAWWYQEMIDTPSPLTERMTLFWHNHFTSSLKKARFPPLMYRQNLALREHALGSFRRMLHRMAKDPAMVLYLDSARNNKRKPNENFAREVMELFTLGEGHYTEKDIKEAARAFTGWGIDRDSGEFLYRRFQHDYGVKTVLGRTGELGGEDVLDVLLAQPACAEFLTGKLWAAFVDADEPAPGPELARLAGVLRKNDYAVRPWLEATLTSDAFWDPARRGRLVKGPVQLMVGTIRTFELGVPDLKILVRLGRRLGQDILDPPNVKGWPGHTRWITSSTLLQRDGILRQALRGMQGGRGVKAVSALPPETMQTLLLATAPVNPQPRTLRGFDLLERLVLDPAYQLQ